MTDIGVVRLSRTGMAELYLSGSQRPAELAQSFLRGF